MSFLKETHQYALFELLRKVKPSKKSIQHYINEKKINLRFLVHIIIVIAMFFFNLILKE